MSKLIEPSTERYAAQQAITNAIDKHLEELHRHFVGQSVHRGIEEHPSFVSLVKMGDHIVNYLMHLMIHGGWSYTEYILLKRLTGDKIPSPPHERSGNVPFLMANTILWWIDSEYYENDNVYYGLVE